MKRRFATLNSSSKLINELPGKIKISCMNFIAAAFFSFICISAFAQTAPELGEAQRFGTLAGDSISSTDSTNIKGDIGAKAGAESNIRGDGGKFTGDDCIIDAALQDLIRAKNTAREQPATSPLPSYLQNTTLASGVYASSFLRVQDTIVLSGDSTSVFIFNIDDSLIFESQTVIILDGVKAENVYWNVSGTVCIEDSASVCGTVMADGSICCHRDAEILQGRLLTTESIRLEEPATVDSRKDSFKIEDINLGASEYFALLAGENIYANTAININGNAGALRNISGTIHTGDTLFSSNACRVQQALSDAGSAVVILSNIDSLLSLPSGTGGLNNLSLPPGFYSIAGNTSLTGEITLTGDSSSIYFFSFGDLKTQYDFIVESGAKLNLGNVKAENVYWFAGNVVLKAGIDFSGIIFSSGNIASYGENTGKTALLARGNIIISENASFEYIHIWSRHNIKENLPPVYLFDIPLGSAAYFALLAGSNITSIDTTIALGNAGAVGTMANVVATDTLFPSNHIRVQEALADLTAARQIADTLIKRELPQSIGNMSLNPGAYSITGDAALNGGLTLTGDSASKFLFYFSGGFTAKSGSSIKLNGVLPENVFWLASGNILLEPSSAMQGVVIGVGNVESKSNNLLKLALFSLDGDILIEKNNPQAPAIYVAPNDQTLSQHLGDARLEIIAGDVQACGTENFSVILNLGDFQYNIVRFWVQLPPGLRYLPNSVNAGSVFVFESNISNLELVEIGVQGNANQSVPIPPNTDHVINFSVTTGCATGGQDSLSAFVYYVLGNDTLLPDTSNTFQVLSPNLTIAQNGINPHTMIVNLTDDTCRTVTVTNNGNAPLTQGFTLIENYGPSVEIYSVTGLSGTINSLNIDSLNKVYIFVTDILPPGGSFTFRECFRVIECTENDTASDLGKSEYSYYWGCTATDTCQADGTIANAVIPKSNVPNISTSLSFADASSCYGPIHASLTKVTISNNGTGHAFDLTWHLFGDSAHMAVTDTTTFWLKDEQGNVSVIQPTSVSLQASGSPVSSTEGYPFPHCNSSFIDKVSFDSLGILHKGKSIEISFYTTTCCPGTGLCGATRTLRDSVSYRIPCLNDTLISRFNPNFYRQTASWGFMESNDGDFNPVQTFDWGKCGFVKDFNPDSVDIMPQWVLGTITDVATTVGDIARFKFKSLSTLSHWNGDATKALKVEIFNSGGFCYIDSSFQFLVRKTPLSAPDIIYPDSVQVNYTCNASPSNCAGTVTAYFSIDTLVNRQALGLPNPQFYNQLHHSEFQIGYITQCGSECTVEGTTIVELHASYMPSLLCGSVCEIPVVCGGSASVSTMVMCPGCDRSGIEFPGFSLERHNYGLPDNNNNGVADALSGAPDMSRVKKNLLMTGDTLNCAMWGEVINLGNPSMPIVLNDSSYFFRYGYYEMSFFNPVCASALTLLQSIEGRIVAAGNTYDFIIDSSMVNKIPAESKYIFDFSIDALHALGVPASYDKFGFGDTIFLNPQFKVTGNINAMEIPCNLLNFTYLAFVPYPQGCPYEGACSTLRDSCGVSVYTDQVNECTGDTAFAVPGLPENICDTSMKYFCEKSGGKFFLSGYRFHVSQPYSTEVENCAQEFNIGCSFTMGYQTSPSQFPFEYRQWGYMDEVQITLPPQFAYDSAILRQSRNRPDTITGSFQQVVFAVDTLSSIGDSTLIFALNTHYTSDSAFALANPAQAIYFSDDNFSVSLTVYAHPNCSTPDVFSNDVTQSNTVPFPASFNFSPNFTPEQNANFSPSLVHRVKYLQPQFTAQGQTSETEAITTTACWNVLFENYSFGNASNIWVAAGQGSISIANLVVNGNTVNAVQGSAGIFPVGFLRAGNFLELQLCATYQCVSDTDILVVYYGWDCPQYPMSIGDYACAPADSFILKLIHRKEKLVQTVVVPATVQLCDTLPVEILLSSTDAANWQNVIASVQLPPGFYYDANDPAVAFYPHNNFSNPLSAPPSVSGNILEWNLDSISPFFAQNGLPGNGFTLSQDSTRVRIRFNLYSDCGVGKNNTLRFQARGVNNCGDTSATLLNIRNIVIGNYPTATQKNLSFSVTGFNVCDSMAAVTLTMVNTDSLFTGDNDVINFFLSPQNINNLCVSYADSSTNLLVGSGIGEPVDTVPGVLTWQVPQGLAPGDTFSFSFDLFAFGCISANPGTILFTANTLTGAQVDCERLDTVCDFIVPAGFASGNAGVPAELQVEFSAMSDPDICDTNCTEQATVTVTGGMFPYTYQWSNGDTTETADSLCPGTHYVTVTDDNGCTVTDSIVILSPSPISVSAQIVCPSSWNNILNNGVELDVFVSGGTAPYQVSLLYPDSSSAAQQGDTVVFTYTIFQTGNYLVSVTDSNGCTALLNFTAPIPLTDSMEIEFGFEFEISQCHSDSDGFIIVSYTDLPLLDSLFAMPFTHLWSTGDTALSVFNLTAGEYFLTITDTLGCSAVVPFTVPVPNPLVIDSLVVTDVLCHGDSTGSAEIVVSGGTAPYSYLWSNGSSTSSAAGLAAGTYSVTATDDNGCSAADSVFINEPLLPLIVFDSIGIIKCSYDSTGGYLAGVTGGTFPYFPQLSSGQNLADTFVVGDSILYAYENMYPGIYFFTVTDANGCVASSDTITILKPAPIVIDISSTGVSCAGMADGSALASVSGGTSPYAYQWMVDGQTLAGFDTLSGLSPGTYTLTVTDTNNCQISDTVVIAQPDSLTLAFTAVPETCPGASDGTASVVVSGGTSPYAYLWSNGDTASQISNLTSQIYILTVTDTNGCVLIDSIFVPVKPLPFSSFTLSQTILCMGDSLHFTNNSIPQSGVIYTWNFGDGSSTSSAAAPTYIYTAPGTYQVVLTVTDSCGRFHSSAQVVTVIPSDSTYNTDCCSENTFYHQSGNLTIASTADITNFISFLATNGNNIKMKGDLIIKPGQTLALNNTRIQFHLLSRVIVETGATLTLDSNTVLTGLDSCRTMWQGIEVWGRNDKTHSGNDTTLQGKIVVRNATVRRAHIGILAGKREPKCFKPPVQYCPIQPCLTIGFPCKLTPVNISSGGGIIRTGNNARFDTCGVAIRFTPFANPNISSIQNTVFAGGILPDPGYKSGNSYTYPGNNQFFASANPSGRAAVGLWQWSVKGVTIKNNSFQNIETAAESFDAKYNITGCSFKVHENGIRIFNSASTVTNGRTIQGCLFDSITYMIWIDGGRFDVVKNLNVFGDSLSQSPQQINQYGVIAINSSNYRVVNNKFNRLGIGIIPFNSGTGGGYAGYEQDWNYFTRCNTGIFTLGDNPRLRLKCNANDNIDSADYSGINWLNFGSLADQGSNPGQVLQKHKYAAGNKFEPLARKQINAWQPTSMFDYYHHSDTVLFRPVPAGSLSNSNLYNIGVASQGNSSCLSPLIQTVYGPKFNSPLTDSIAVLLEALQEEYERASVNIDRGNTAALITAINKQPPMQPGQLKNLLLNHSPLSDAVLLALCRRNPPLPHGTFKEVILPNSPVSKQVRPVLDSLLAGFPNGVRNEIIAAQTGQDGNRTLTAIEREITDLTVYRQENISIFINSLLESGDDSLKQLALGFLEDEGTVEANLMLFSTYLSDSNLVSAANKLAQVPDTTTELQQWKAIASILLSLALDSNTVFEMDSAQQQTVRQIAGTAMILDGEGTMGLAASNAQAILRLVYGEEFPLIISLPAAKTGTSSHKSGDPSLPPSEGVGGWLLGDNIPNPFKETTVIPYSLGSGTENAALRITDAVGRTMKEIPLKPKGRAVELETQGWNNGVYFYSLLIEGQTVQTKQMVLLK